MGEIGEQGTGAISKLGPGADRVRPQNGEAVKEEAAHGGHFLQTSPLKSRLAGKDRPEGFGERHLPSSKIKQRANRWLSIQSIWRRRLEVFGWRRFLGASRTNGSPCVQHEVKCRTGRRWVANPFRQGKESWEKR